jgi:hypothetical protein
MTRSRSLTGTVTTAVLVAAFGNQWVSDWLDKHFTGNNILTLWVHQLTSPHWSLSFSGSSNALRGVVAEDARAVLTVLIVYVLLVSFRKTFPEGFAGFILGWSTLIFSSAIATLLAAFIVPGATLTGVVSAGSVASIYGLYVGWIVGFIVSVGRNIPWVGKTTAREGAAA